MSPSSLKYAKKFQEDLTNLVLNIEKNTKPSAISKKRHAIQLPQQFQMMPATLKMKNIVLLRLRPTMKSPTKKSVKISNTRYVFYST